MLKAMLLAGAVLMSTPALAQTAPGGAQTVPPPADNGAPVPTPDPAAGPAPAPQPAPAPAPAAPLPDPNAQAGAPAPAPAAPVATAEPAPAPAAPVATAGPAPAPAPGAAVAEVVKAEFGTYDKNANGSLNKVEFSAWMNALRTKADPNLKNDAANKTWLAQAFTQADADKSKSVSQDELTNFLAQAPKAS